MQGTVRLVSCIATRLSVTGCFATRSLNRALWAAPASLLRSQGKGKRKPQGPRHLLCLAVPLVSLSENLELLYLSTDYVLALFLSLFVKFDRVHTLLCTQRVTLRLPGSTHSWPGSSHTAGTRAPREDANAVPGLSAPPTCWHARKTGEELLTAPALDPMTPPPRCMARGAQRWRVLALVPQSRTPL